MKTPIFDFVNEYSRSGMSRLHMPGHKGVAGLNGIEAYDITEIQGADFLSQPEGIILQSEKNASLLFDSKHTFYSTEGSSLSIRAMIAFIAGLRKDKSRPLTLLAGRNAHRTFILGCGLVGANVIWMEPDTPHHLCHCDLTPENIADFIDQNPQADAVYITSPDYLGNIADISGISKICHQRNIPLLVDNAHGAYLKFLEQSIHPLSLGADIVCDSAHKTLPVLTGGAYLHISKNFYPEMDLERLMRRSMALFASTSPSYLILQSLDLCNRYIADEMADRLKQCVEKVNYIKNLISSLGHVQISREPLKITLSHNDQSLIAKALAEANIEAEFVDPQYAVLMFTPALRQEDFDRVASFVRSLPVFPKDPPTLPSGGSHKQAMSLRDSILANSQKIDIKKAVGRICASPAVSCPPAVPIVISGEVITPQDVETALYYGIQQIDVVVQ